MESSNVISTHAAAHQIQEELTAIGYEQFVLRPWNRFDPEDTIWWLVPSPEWPAFNHAKLVLYKTMNDFTIGIHFEKGFSASAAHFSSRKGAVADIIQVDWIWHTMLADLKCGLLGKRLYEISQAMGAPLLLQIYATGINERDHDAPKMDLLRNSIQFSLGGKSFGLIEGSAKGVLDVHHDTNAVEHLMGIFERKDLEWYWLDFHVVFEVPFAEHTRLTEYAEIFVKQYGEFF